MYLNKHVCNWKCFPFLIDQIYRQRFPSFSLLSLSGTRNDQIPENPSRRRSQILCCSRNTNSRCNNKMSLKEARGEVNEHIDQHEDTATTRRRGGLQPRRAPGWILLLDQLRVQVKKMTKLCQVDSSHKMNPLLVTSALLPATSPSGKRGACLPGKSSTSPSSLP